MMDDIKQRIRAYYIFCLILAVVLFFYGALISFRFENAMLYLGEQPYKWGENTSTLFSSEYAWFWRVSLIELPTIGWFLRNCRKPWTLAESRMLVWLFTIAGVFLLLYGSYQLSIYHGRELYAFEEPLHSSTGQTYIFDTFIYLPMIIAAVEVAGGLYLLYKLYWRKQKEGR